MSNSASSKASRSAYGRLMSFLPSLILTWAALASPFAASAQTAAATASTERVVVTANRSVQPLSSVLADISYVDRTSIERSGAYDVAELLAGLPGIEYARNGGPGSTTGVFIRGNEARHAAVYIDGVRVDSQSTGGAAWEQLPLDQIDRIEVLRGPAAAIYGSDAVAGVVQLFTKRGQGAHRPTASLTVGSYGTVQAQAGVSGSAGPLDYAVSASHGRSEGFNARTVASANPDKDGWRRSSANARLGYALDGVHRLDASVLATRLRAQFDGFDAGVDDVNHSRLTTASLAWQGRWSAEAQTRVQVGHSESTFETQPSFYRTETTLRNATLQHEQRLGQHLLTATLERREDELFNPATAFAGALRGSRHQDGIGLGWRTDFGSHGLQAHVRRDEDSEFGGKSTGSLAWGWRFMPQWRLSAAAATSFRAPTLYQRFSEYGNPSLVPESGRNVELGLRWTTALGEASLSAWRNTVTNLINFGAPGPCLDAFGCYVNVGSAQLEGLTLSGRAQLQGLALNGSVSWHDPRNLQTQTTLQRRARQLGLFGVETVAAGWTLGAEVQAAGPRYEDAANTQRLAGYGLLNLVASTKLAPGLSLQGRIDNAGDKAYELARSYATAGRSAQLSLRWTLN